MTTNHSSAARPGSAAVPVSERDREKRSRGSYRQQLTAPRPGVSGAGTEAKRAAAVILEVLAGVRTPTAAAAALAIRLPRYYLLEQRAVQGLSRRASRVLVDESLALTGGWRGWSVNWPLPGVNSAASRRWRERPSARWGWWPHAVQLGR